MTYKQNIKLFILIFFLLSCSAPKNQVVIRHDAVNWHNNVNHALVLSKQNRKPVFMYFSSPHCKPCENMEKEVFSNHELANYIHDNVIPVKIGYENSPHSMNYKVYYVPTIVMLSSYDHREMYNLTGYQKAEHLKFIILMAQLTDTAIWLNDLNGRLLDSLKWKFKQ